MQRPADSTTPWTMRCAFLGMDDLTGFVSDDLLARAPLLARGIELTQVSWRDGSVRWQDFDQVVIRNTWDYHQNLAEFLRALQNIAEHTRLANDLEVVRRNVDKSYLRDLSTANVPIVPSLFADEGLYTAIGPLFDHFETDELIVKPQVSANAQDTFRLRRGETARHEYVQMLFSARKCIVQPFVRSVLDRGEHSLLYFGGKPSHAVAKVPASGDFRVQEEHGGRFTAITASDAERDVAERALAMFGGELLYARVDLVADANGDPMVMEVELVEPSLYLRYDPGAAERFAEAIATSMPQAI